MERQAPAQDDMLSAVCRESTRQGSEPWLSKAKVIDPENRLLWRMNLRRLDTEILRDSVIAAAGKLDSSMGGEPIPLETRPDGSQVVSDKVGKWRRSIYLHRTPKLPDEFPRLIRLSDDRPQLHSPRPLRDAAAIA
jgi:hypothetical protein